MSQELKAISNAKIAYLKTERLQPLWLVRCSCVEQKDCWLSDLELWCQGFNETYFGFCVFAPGSSNQKSLVASIARFRSLDVIHCDPSL